ncbi:MAG: 16S rRNA (cytidine(1402)-2'-O)-methyltransferase [Acidimicrobiia bacterium]
MPGTLVLCATPIGNLGDVSTRLAETLEEADIVFAEDTRRTAKLLNHLGISTQMRSFFEGNQEARLVELRSLLAEDRMVALVSDAGTPVVSDPGASAVLAAVESNAIVTAIPGPSAVGTALAVSGFDGDRFVFEGFLPRKGDDRTAVLKRIADEHRTTVFFAAPSRVAKDLADLALVVGEARAVVVARELTKIHEEVWRGTANAAAEEFAPAERARGEFTVVIEGSDQPEPDMDAAKRSAASLIDDGSSMSDAVRDASLAYGVSRRELYEAVLRSRTE